eukprot:TRINITY_DN790_c0_g1_i1.p1 TRINITY_DN790_c0_g1~~TRINITY_DN790_c0_g1_i1.p1  ORF type:complete len:66 (+),score=3.76 TRINITY_DN790_c0_g1_i1:497-694(+)
MSSVSVLTFVPNFVGCHTKLFGLKAPGHHSGIHCGRLVRIHRHENAIRKTITAKQLQSPNQLSHN